MGKYCLQASADRLIKAYGGYYDRRTGAPRFKKRKTNPVTSITLRNNFHDTKEGNVGAIRWLSENELRVTKLGKITVKHRKHIKGQIKEATLKYENGRWYICIVYELYENRHDEFSYGGLYVGIDFGLTDFLTFSNGKAIAKPALKKINERIQYYQRKLDGKK